MCLNRGMALPERGAPFTTAGFARIERLGKIAEIVVRGTSPTCSGTLVGTRLPIGGTTLAALGEVAETGRWDLR
jgi:hypothetical protein